MYIVFKESIEKFSHSREEKFVPMDTSLFILSQNCSKSYDRKTVSYKLQLIDKNN